MRITFLQVDGALGLRRTRLSKFQHFPAKVDPSELYALVVERNVEPTSDSHFKGIASRPAARPCAMFGSEDSPLEESDRLVVLGGLFRPSSASHLVLALEVVTTR